MLDRVEAESVSICYGLFSFGIFSPRRTMSQCAPMYIVAQKDDETAETEVGDFRAKVTRQTRFTRRKSVAAERYDPEADDDDDDVCEDGCEETSSSLSRKSDEQRHRLREAVAHILIFRSLDSDQVDHVIDAMFERQVAPGEHVIRQGDDGDNFYVIESGSYDVTVRDESSPAADEDAERRVHRFDGKGSFGELALMYNVPRSATITAVTSGTLWAMNRKSFRKIVLKSAYRKRKRYERLLESVPMLSSLDAYERMNLADALTSAIFQDGDRIIRVGAEADGMYFVEEGDVRVMIVKDGAETEVARMGTGSYFGEMALVEHTPRTASVYAVGRTKTAFLERNCFERLLGPCLDIMKRNIDSYKTNS